MSFRTHLTALAIVAFPLSSAAQGLVGNTIDFEIVIPNIDILDKEGELISTTVTADASDSIVLSDEENDNGITFTVDPGTTTIDLKTTGEGFALFGNSYIEFTRVNFPFEDITGAFITSTGGSLGANVSVTSTSVRLDFVGSPNLFAAGSVHTINFTTISNLTTTPASQVIAGDLLSNSTAPEFRVLFSETVTGFDPADLGLNFTGTLAPSGPVVISGSGTEFTATVPVTGDGTLTVDLAPNAELLLSGVPTTVGTRIPSLPISIDQTPPTVTDQILSAKPIISGSEFQVEIQFSEDIVGASSDSVIAVLTSSSNVNSRIGYARLTESRIRYSLIPDLDPGLTSGQVESGITNTGHNITDLAGNPLSLVPALLVTPIIPNNYEQWLADTGLPVSSGHEFDDNGDRDGLDNFEEFLRNGNPLLRDTEPRRLFHLAELDGKQHGVLTIAMRDDHTYELEEDLVGGRSGPYHYYEVAGKINGDRYYDTIYPTVDLENFGEADVFIDKVSALPIPAALPPLDPGWSYRHFRFRRSVDEQGKAFMLVEPSY